MGIIEIAKGIYSVKDDKATIYVPSAEELKRRIAFRLERSCTTHQCIGFSDVPASGQVLYNLALVPVIADVGESADDAPAVANGGIDVKKQAPVARKGLPGSDRRAEGKSAVLLSDDIAQRVSRCETNIVFMDMSYRQYPKKDLLLVGRTSENGGKCYGIVKLSAPRMVTDTELATIAQENGCPEDFIAEFSANNKVAFAYFIKKLDKWEKPLDVNIPLDANNFVREIEFKDAVAN